MSEKRATRVRNKYKYDVPLWHRPILSVAEATEYFGIGSNKIYELTEKENCPFVIWIPASEKSEPRSECATIFRTGGSDKTYTSLICRQTKTAMTDAGDNDTSVIRGRAIKKARG